MAIQTEKLLQGPSIQTIFSAEAALANNTFSAVSAANFGTTQHGDFPYALFELICQFGVAPDPDRRIALYLLKSIDAGSTYEEEASVTYDNFNQIVGWFTPEDATTSQILALSRSVPLVKDQKFMLHNDATSQEMNLNYTLRCLPITRIFDDA